MSTMAAMSPKNKAVPNAREFYPLNEPSIGVPYEDTVRVPSFEI
jgi:hypothetical protein